MASKRYYTAYVRTRNQVSTPWYNIASLNTPRLTPYPRTCCEANPWPFLLLIINPVKLLQVVSRFVRASQCRVRDCIRAPRQLQSLRNPVSRRRTDACLAQRLSCRWVPRSRFGRLRQTAAGFTYQLVRFVAVICHVFSYCLSPSYDDQTPFDCSEWSFLVESHSNLIRIQVLWNRLAYPKAIKKSIFVSAAVYKICWPNNSICKATIFWNGISSSSWPVFRICLGSISIIYSDISLLPFLIRGE